MTEIKPFSLNFQPESTIFVIDEFSQHKTALLNEYCYTHSPIVINDINQLISQTVDANRKLVLDCVLKWDDMWQYNYVADTLMCHTGGLLMFMSKPVAFDKMIRAKADYLILFRGRNIRYMRKIHRQYLTPYISDSIELINKFKTLSWGQGLVLDLSGMENSGKFEGNYYYYDSHVDNHQQQIADLQPKTEYSGLDTTINNWVAEFKDSAFAPNWEVINGPDHVPVNNEENAAKPDVVPKITVSEAKSDNGPTLPVSGTKSDNENTLPVSETKSDSSEKPEQGWFSYLFGWASFGNGK